MKPQEKACNIGLYINTPLGVSIRSRHPDGAWTGEYWPGVNLTESGDFISAPGWPPSPGEINLLKGGA